MGSPFATPNIPQPQAAPPPPDEAKPLLREINRAAIDRKLRKSKGRQSAFFSLDGPDKIRQPGSGQTTGG